jgi:hypothetical protein
MVKKLFFPILFISSITALAQSNFEEALIITISGDTLTGLIDNRDWRKNPKLISYKNSENAVTRYSPLDIKGFYLTNTKEWYMSAVIELSKNSLKESDVIKNINQRGYQVDTVFLRLIVKGRVSLYYSFDENFRSHFIIEKNEILEELKIEKKKVNFPKEGIINLEYFKAQLNEYLSDCLSKKFSISNVRYSEESLTSLISNYNRCFATEDIYVRRTEKIKTALSLNAGVNYSKLTINGPAYSSADRNYKPDLTPYAGMSFDVIFPRNRNSWSINNDLIYRYYSIEDLFKANQVKLLTTLRYRFPSPGSARFFLGGGFTNAIALQAQSFPESTTKDFRKHEQGYTFETGIKAKKLSYMLRYEKTNGFSPYSYTNTKFAVFYAGLSFMLNN